MVKRVVRLDGDIVYIVVYYLKRDNGETFATVIITTTGKDVCVVFRTFNLQLNPDIMAEYRLGLNL